MKEKRVYQRHPIELAASYGVPEAEELVERATVVNISGGGFCFSSRNPIEPGTQVKLQVEIREREFVRIDVEAVWNKKIGDGGKYLVGVKVSNCEGEDFEKFLTFYCSKVKNVQEKA